MILSQMVTVTVDNPAVGAVTETESDKVDVCDLTRESSATELPPNSSSTPEITPVKFAPVIQQMMSR